MLTVFLSAIASFAVAGFALAMILREFAGRWPQVVAALSFDERAFSSGDAARAPAPARTRQVTALAQRPARRHAAAA
jgi:hypothetical protein